MAKPPKDPHNYRATFRYPKVSGTSIQVRIAADMTVEVWQATCDRWEARFVATESQARYGKLPKFLAEAGGETVRTSTKEEAQAKIERCFEVKVTDWQPYDRMTGAPAWNGDSGPPAPEAPPCHN